MHIKAIGIISLLLSTVLSAEIHYLSKEKIAELSKKSKFLSKPYMKIIEGIDENNTYFLDLIYRGKPINCFIDKKTGVLYKGERYDAEGKISTFIKSPQRMAKFKKAVTDGVSFSYGNGKKDLYIFTDPECPYCRRFEQQAKGLLDDYKVHVILYPLRFHKHAPAMTEWILQGANDKEKHVRMEKLMVEDNQEYKAFESKDKKPFKYSDTVQKILNRGVQAVRFLNVRGTPAVFDEHFNKLNWGKFLQEERQKKPNASSSQK
ncbi:MAG: hypothetical protein DSZ12_05115 [Sulfurovum sp.]|nr:MAG: hypothetical protein DSZ12_05115 [Sulfurovum sp.]